MSTTNTPSTHQLSARERQVLEAAGSGLTDKEIAKQLGCQFSSIRTYWERIRIKLGALNRAHAVMLAQPNNAIERTAEEFGAFIVRRISDQAIFVVDNNGIIQTWNKGVEELFGYAEAEWVGQHQSIFFIPEEKVEAQKEIDDADQAGASVNDRWHMRRDSSRFWATNTVILLDEKTEKGPFAKIVRTKPEPQQE